MQRDIFGDRDWFLIILVLLAFAVIGTDIVFVAHYASAGNQAGAWLNGLGAVLTLVLMIPFIRYNRWAYLVYVALFGFMAVLGIFQAAGTAAGDFLSRFEGYTNVIAGLVFAVGLLGRWKDFMGPAARGPEPVAAAPAPAAPEALPAQGGQPEPAAGRAANPDEDEASVP